MNLFQKAGKGLNLTPGERAVLKLVEGFLIAGFVAALPVVAELLGHQGITWQVVAQAAAGAFATAFLLAIAKYYKAKGDNPIAAGLAETLAGYIPRLPIVNSAASLAPTAPMPAAPATVPSVPVSG